MKIVIIGAGGFGREVLALINSINRVQQTFDVLGFLDDGLEKGKKIHDLEILGGIEEYENCNADGAVLAVGNPRIRENIFLNLPARTQFPNLIHPSVIFLDEQRVKIGTGNIICAGNIFTTDIKLGNNIIINLSSTIGHDAVIGDFCSIMPGVNISGGAHLKKGVYIGTGAKLIKATVLGDYATVGAGAVVDQDVKPGATVVGVPARPIKRNK